MNKKNTFIHIPRTAGSSFGYIFNRSYIKFINHDIRDPNYQSLEDYLKNEKLESQKNNFPYRAEPLRIYEISKPILVNFTSVYNKEDKFIFAFVRNPWDRVVSSFFYLNNGGNNPEDEKDRILFLEKYNNDFRLFVRKAFTNKSIFNQLHFRPQYEWICDKKKNLLVNFIGRFENLEEDLNRLQKILSINFDTLPHVNKSIHEYYKEYYDEETKEIIRDAYKTDIDLFKYDF